MKPDERKQLIALLDVLRMQIMRCCATCENWQDGCSLVDHAKPPAEVQEVGCPQWVFEPISF